MIFYWTILIFINLDARYAEYFIKYSCYFGIALRLRKAMYGMNNSRKIFFDELTEWMIESGFIQFQYQIPL